jgi:hypothetical protein
MDAQRGKRLAFLISSMFDMLIGGVALLIYFDLFPFDVSGWGIPHWVFGAVGAVLTLFGVVVFAYTLNVPETHE